MYAKTTINGIEVSLEGTPQEIGEMLMLKVEEKKERRTPSVKRVAPAKKPKGDTTWDGILGCSLTQYFRSGIDAGLDNQSLIAQAVQKAEKAGKVMNKKSLRSVEVLLSTIRRKIAKSEAPKEPITEVETNGQ